jgi:hypothetical protein
VADGRVGVDLPSVRFLERKREGRLLGTLQRENDSARIRYLIQHGHGRTCGEFAIKLVSFRDARIK